MASPAGRCFHAPPPDTAHRRAGRIRLTERSPSRSPLRTAFARRNPESRLRIIEQFAPDRTHVSRMSAWPMAASSKRTRFVPARMARAAPPAQVVSKTSRSCPIVARAPKSDSSEVRTHRRSVMTRWIAVLLAAVGLVGQARSTRRKSPGAWRSRRHDYSRQEERSSPKAGHAKGPASATTASVRRRGQLQSVRRRRRRSQRGARRHAGSAVRRRDVESQDAQPR